jgi:hypothetical protein
LLGPVAFGQPDFPGSPTILLACSGIADNNIVGYLHAKKDKKLG